MSSDAASGALNKPYNLLLTASLLQILNKSGLFAENELFTEGAFSAWSPSLSLTGDTRLFFLTYKLFDRFVCSTFRWMLLSICLDKFSFRLETSLRPSLESVFVGLSKIDIWIFGFNEWYYCLLLCAYVYCNDNYSLLAATRSRSFLLFIIRCCLCFSRSLYSLISWFRRDASSIALRIWLTRLHIACSLNRNCLSRAYFRYLLANSWSEMIFSPSLKNFSFSSFLRLCKCDNFDLSLGRGATAAKSLRFSGISFFFSSSFSSITETFFYGLSWPFATSVLLGDVGASSGNG